MKFTDLYNLGIKYWPEEIDISTGKPTAADGYLFPELTSVHDIIEEQVSKDSGIIQVIIWAMFQAFHDESKSLIKAGEHILHTGLVKKTEIEWRVRENLEGDDWKSERDEYVNDLQKT